MKEKLQYPEGVFFCTYSLLVSGLKRALAPESARAEEEDGQAGSAVAGPTADRPPLPEGWASPLTLSGKL